MKTNNSILNKVIELSEVYLYQYDDMKFPQEYLESDFMDSYQRLLDDLVPAEANGTWLSFFEEMALYHIEYVMYLMLESSEEKEKMLLHFSLSNAYTELLIETVNQSKECLHPSLSIWMKTGGLFLANHIIANDWTSAEKTLASYIASINGNSSIIGYGHPEHQESWFILDLAAKVFNKSYSQDRAYLPEKYEIFAEVLESWNTEDIKKMTIFIEKLCERHLLVNRLALQDRYDKEEAGEGVLYVNVHNFMFPYEILTWLKLREHAGIKNPKTFSHPLMNTPIAKMFLDIKEPLPKPTELPYAKELLEKLKEKCPDVEIPEWLNTRDNTEELLSKEASQPTNTQTKEPNIDTTNPKTHAQSTGDYQAFLPEGHPLTDKLKAEPMAYSYHEKGQQFSYIGLEEFEVSLIEWRLKVK